MKQLLSARHRLVTALLPTVLLLTMFVSCTAPTPVFAATFECQLPDGSGGVYLADGRTCCPPNQSDGTSCFYAKYVNPTIAVLSGLVGIAVTAAIIYGGIEVLTSAGDPQRVAAGRKRIIGALVGLGAFLVLYAALQFLLPGGIFNAG